MKNLKNKVICIISLSCLLALVGWYLFPMYQQDVLSAGNTINEVGLIPGGIPVGIYMDTDGVMVIDTQEIIGINGKSTNPCEKLIESGDYITSIDSVEIETKNDLLEEVKELNGSKISIGIRRGEENLLIEVTPTKDKLGDYKLGIWVRDNLQGLGTLTYVDAYGNFGALGHGIHDVDTNKLLEITDGELYRASITGIIQGKSGSPGGLEGLIIYNKYNNIGTININDNSGIYGIVNDVNNLSLDTSVYGIASKEEIKKGNAVIRCTIDGKIEEYDIKITKINYFDKEVNKGLSIEIIDQELINKTGGIIQGMSGSPILQGNKIIGAVTHVMVNDPTKGYGIFIENMLEMSKTIN